MDTIDAFYNDVSGLISDFDLLRCLEVEALEIRKTGFCDINIKCDLRYGINTIICIEFIKAWKIKIECPGGTWSVCTLSISYPPGIDEPGYGYYFHDEHSAFGWCFEEMHLVSVKGNADWK